MQVHAEGECRLRCVDEEQCRSYNFGLKKHKAGNFLCQLNGSDKSVGFGNFTKDDNFKYRGMEVIKVKEEWPSVKARGGTPYNGQYGKENIATKNMETRCYCLQVMYLLLLFCFCFCCFVFVFCFFFKTECLRSQQRRSLR